MPKTASGERDDWVVLRRYDDGMNAQIAVDFLRDHGVPVALRGNSGVTSVLNRFDTVLDVRLIVRERDLPRARETLLALESPGEPIESPEEMGPSSGHPYRDTRPAGAEPMPRYRRAAFALALMLPIGAGHFYAGEAAAGAVFAVGIAAASVAAFLAHSAQPAVAAVFMVGLDALTALGAVARHNAGQPASRGGQLLRAGVCIGLAAVLSFVVE
jgi:hypothetical protein